MWHHATKDLQTKCEPNAIKGQLGGYEGRNQYRVYCNHSIIITRDVDFVPPVPMAVLYPPVAIIKKDDEKDSGVALKPSKGDSLVDTPPAAESHRSQDNQITLIMITVKSLALRTAVDDEATSTDVALSRRQSSQKNASIFSTPQVHKEQSQSTPQTGSNQAHDAVALATTSIEEP
jgi:hypothetical protein